jgi:hypothetical protein
MTPRRFGILAIVAAISGSAFAQEKPSDPDPMAMMEMMEPEDRWMPILHGYAFLNVNRQGGPSGDRNFESQNHLMAVALRRLV